MVEMGISVLSLELLFSWTIIKLYFQIHMLSEEGMMSSVLFLN